MKFSHLFIVFGLLLGATNLQAQQMQPSGQVDPCPLYVPNAFTPNGDNVNDVFLIRVGEDCKVLSYEMQIFDRWGRMVYQSQSLLSTDAWDGQMDNNLLRPGVYMFRLNAKLIPYNDPKGEPKEVNRHGSVVLIR